MKGWFSRSERRAAGRERRKRRDAVQRQVPGGRRVVGDEVERHDFRN